MSGLYLRICSLIVFLSTGLSLIAQVRTLQWGGELVTSSQLLRNAQPQKTALDLDGDGASDDSITQYPFSETTPLSPITGYSGVRVYGGVRGEALNRAPNFDEQSIVNSGTNDFLGVRHQLTSTGQSGKFWFLMFGDKADFLNGGSTLPVQFDEFSKLEVNLARWEAVGSGRWVVRDGSSYYVSQSTFTSTATLTFSSAANDGNWAPFNPAASLNFAQASAVFAPMNFSNITAVGIMADKDTFSAARHWVQVRTLQVTAQVGSKPAVTIIAPANGSVVAGPSDLLIETNASDSDGTVTNVQFFNGASSLGSDGSSPFSLSWAGVQPGSYTLKAKAVDNLGQSSDSAVVNVIVNTPPSVSLTSPADGSVFGSAQTVIVSANASDSIGGLQAVEFFAGSQSIGVDNAAPFSVSWIDIPSGVYTLTATATDVHGFSTTSSAVSITVTDPPQVSLTSPANGTLFVEPANIEILADASDSDGSISKVDFYAGSTLIGSLASSPYALSWIDVQCGDYSLFAIATDNLNFSATSGSVAIKVNAPPVIALWNLSNGMSFAPPADIAMLANASDKDGTVSEVDFYSGTTLVGNDSTAPYGILWSQVAEGTYDLVARATDNLGTTGDSQHVQVNVNLPDGALPAPWRSVDIGGVAAPGSASYASGIFTIKGAGSPEDPVKNFRQDTLQYVYWGLIGDGEIVARVLGVHGPSPLARAGVMIRESLEDDVTFAELSLRPVHPHHASAATSGEDYENYTESSEESGRLAQTGWLPDHCLVCFQARRFIVTPQEEIPVPVLRSAGVLNVPHWVKIQRIGNIVKAYRSEDGSNWVHVHSQNLALGNRAYVGLSVTSRQGASLTTAMFDNVSVASVQPNDPPAISFISPEDATVYDVPALIPLEVFASDSDIHDDVQSVAFYQGTTLIAVDESSPFQASWQAEGTGWRYFTARAHDFVGNTTSAGPVQVLLNEIPEVSLVSPANGAIFASSSEINLSAEAFDFDGSVALVEFYAGDQLIGSSIEEPYSINWITATEGAYPLTAVAYDDQDGQGVSSPVSITIHGVPSISIVSPASGSVYPEPADILVEAASEDAEATLSIVEFFAGTTLIGSDDSSPYSVSWTGVPKGSYPLVARATDTLGFVSESDPVFVSVKGLCGSASGGPTDNPVATKYGPEAYPWTDNINWDCVYNIHDYPGANMVAQFNAARDAAALDGGGVIYFPSGTYHFHDTIRLTNSVVLRGANPPMDDAKQAGYQPPTRLEFPQYIPSLSGSGTPNSTAFKTIRNGGSSDRYTGVVNVDANRVSIKFSITEGVLLFGIRSNNSAEPDTGVPTSWQNAWQRWSYRFNYNLSGTASSRVLIANNRLNDAVTDTFEQPGYIVRDGTTLVTLTNGSQARFHFANHYGINARSSAGTPFVVVRDNWVFHTMRVAIYAKGEGLVIQDNVIRDEPGKSAWVDPTGQRLVGNSNTLENRAIDFAGFNVVITGNDYEVYRHFLKTGPYFSVDGEGILAQECCGGTLVKGLTISNNHGPNPTYIGLYKVREIDNVLINNNTVVDGSFGIYVAADTNNGPFRADDVRIHNNSVRGPIGLYANVPTGSGNEIIGNFHPTGSNVIKHSCEANATISGNIGFTVEACH